MGNTAISNATSQGEYRFPSSMAQSTAGLYEQDEFSREPSRRPSSAMMESPYSTPSLALGRSASIASRKSLGADSVSTLTEEEIQDRLIRKEAEKRRRDSLKVGYDEIKELLPAEMVVAPGKRKNAPNQQVLAKAADYIEDLKREEQAKQLEIQQLEETIHAMKFSLMGNALNPPF
ncbi:UNVERIFIED_CONTAM: hypothetical protein HDU68_005852 [Siphonaria sp. JEL0065]|nr:hypothetical protein HDU68_005852 [Siphonaria sp. JEL0065]